MTDTTMAAPASVSSSGMTSEEKTAAAGFTFAGLLLFGPMGGIVAALAVGIEQAFLQAGWDKPDFLKRQGLLSPEELAERRRQAVAEAEAHLARLRAAAQARRELLEPYRQALREWIGKGREGDKPERPRGAVRNPWEFLTETLAASKSRYKLFEHKIDNANKKITGTYPKIGAFFGDLLRFITGFAQGAKTGWEQYQQELQRRAGAGTPDDGPRTEPASAVTAEPQRPAIIPAPAPGVDPEPAAGSGPPEPDPAPTPLHAAGRPQGLSTGPAGPSAGTVEGDVMDDDVVVLPAGGAPVARGIPQGETNLDLILQLFQPIPPLLASVDRQLPDLQEMQLAIHQQLNWVRSIGAVYRLPDVAWHMLEQVDQVVAALGAGLRQIHANNQTARELGQQALLAMKPARDDLDVVHAHGGSGEVFANAAEAGA